jgi:hypothetical protein
MCTVATFNVAGYESFRDNDNIANVAQYIGTHQDIERYMKQRKDDGEEVVVMGLQEHWLHDGEDMQEYSEHGAHMRYRTVPHIGDGSWPPVVPGSPFRGCSGVSRGPVPGCPGVCSGVSRGRSRT